MLGEDVWDEDHPNVFSGVEVLAKPCPHGVHFVYRSFVLLCYGQVSTYFRPYKVSI